MSSPKNIIEKYKDAFENKQGTKLLTQSEALFIRAVMTLNRTSNEQKEKRIKKN